MSLILLLVTGNFAYNRYLDWDNAQMIKGLARDFPQLVREVEQATGLELEIKSNCMTTTEKFNPGVRTCEWSVVKNPIDQNALDKYKELLEQQTIIKQGTKKDHKEYPYYKYRKKDSCDVNPSEYIYISCITGVREANANKIRSLLLPQ